MDKLLLNNAIRIDKNLQEIKHELVVTLDNIEKDITAIIIEEGIDDKLRDELLDSVQEIVDKIEDAVISCPKKGTLTKIISKFY